MSTMPCLPSGLHFALDSAPLTQLMQNAAADPQQFHDLMRIEELPHLSPYISILFFRPRGTLNAYWYLDNRFAMPPADMEPYDSGHTLATIAELQKGWSSEDQAAFTDHMHSERFLTYLLNCLKCARDLQDELHSEDDSLSPLSPKIWRESCQSRDKDSAS